jgi:hypothetical protein
MRQYSADLIKVQWLGLSLEGGLAEGTFIQPSANATTWTQKPNGYGGTLQLYNPDTSGTLSMIFDQESIQHCQLQALANADRIGQAIVAPLLILDNNVRELTMFVKARIQTMPDPSKGTGPATIAWVWIYESARTQVFDPGKAEVGT